MLFCVTIVYEFTYYLLVCFPELESCEDPIEVKQEILTVSCDLCEEFEPEDVKKISRSLKFLGSLSRYDVERIQHEATTDDKAEKLLDILQTKPNKAYYKLLVCLYNVRRDLYSRVRAIQEKTVQSKDKLRLIAVVMNVLSITLV